MLGAFKNPAVELVTSSGNEVAIAIKATPIIACPKPVLSAITSPNLDK
jgi:hypothetical protein